MFDYVNFAMPCPNCGADLKDFQSKDEGCNIDRIEPDGLMTFYALCRCKHWVEFSRQRPDGHPARETPLTREQVEAMGFSLSVTAPNVL
jgi:hypothetical protein